MSDKNSGTRQPGFSTRAVHAGAGPDPATGARAVPIYQTTSFAFKSTEHAANLFALREAGYIYSRLTNPTVGALEARMAALEGGTGATCTASGHAAQLIALFALMEAGDHMVASTRLYGGSLAQFGHSFRKFGWHVSFVDFDDVAAVRAAIGPKTKAIFAESLANPGGIVTDLETIAAVARDAGVPLVIDNTLATPYLCQPIEWGAEIVVHSTTKFLSGNGTAIGGAIVEAGRFDWARSGKYPSLTEPEPAYHGVDFLDTFGNLALTIHCHAVGLRDLGPSQSPFNAFLTLAGIETLALRMERHSQNALAVARYLEAHPAVSWVSYAGLESSPYYQHARKYLPKGAGAVFTFGLKGGHQAGIRLVESVKLFSHLANVGDTRSLIIHPSSTTHSQLTAEQKRAAGAGDEVIRLSVGIEDVDDIIADLDQGLGQAMKDAA